MSHKPLILLGAALSVAFAQSSPPTNVTFDHWTSPQGELVRLNGLNRTSRDYRVTALSRLDPNRPGYILEPYNGQRDPVRTYDRRVGLNSREKTPVEITYKPTQVAYLKIDYAHSGVSTAWMYWNGRQIYDSGNRANYHPVWGILWVLSFGTIALFWIPSNPGEFHTTLPIPLDGRVHTLLFGAGGNCLSFNGAWEESYQFDSRRMQAGKIYWVEAKNYCLGDIRGELKQRINPVRVEYHGEGLPQVVPIGTPGWYASHDSWYDPYSGKFLTTQAVAGRHASLTGKRFDYYNSFLMSENAFSPPSDTLPYDLGWITVSQRYKVIHYSNIHTEVDEWIYDNQLNQITLYYCGGWEWVRREEGEGLRCVGESRTATFALTSASQPDPLHINLDSLDRAAFNGTVSYETRTGTDRDGRRVTWQELQSNPTAVPRTYTIRETWRCISGSCP